MKDFFVSYNGKDKPWAEWISYQLEEAGYTTVIQAWDFRPGGNFVLEMQKAVIGTERTIAVLSQNYLDAEYTQPEWAAVFAKDSQGADRKLIPVRIAECKPVGLLAPIIYIDLVGKDEQVAIEALLAGIAEGRPKPPNALLFPGQPTSGPVPSKPKPNFPGSPSARSNLLYPRNPFFTGRENFLDQLHDTLTINGIAALSGLGGIGKTQTAVEYAYQHRKEYEAVFWASAATELAPVASYVEMAKRINLPEKDAQNQNDTVSAVKVWLENNSGWLLIFDNADKPESIKPFLPDDPKGYVLVTSRAQVFDTLGIAKPIEMAKMQSEEAVQFLYKRTGRDNHELAEKVAAEQIGNELGGLPLALEQAGAYIAKMRCRFQDYLVSYNNRGLELLEKTKAVIGEYPKSVATTWSLNFEQVEQTSQASADLLRFSAFLNTDKIPLELITLGARELGPSLSVALANVAADPLALDEVLEPLTQYSLIRRDLESQTYDIHRLVQTVLKNNLDEASQHLWAERTVRAVNRTFPNVEFIAWPRCERLLPHAQVCADLIEKWGLELSETARLLDQAGFYLRERVRFAEAEIFQNRALEIRKKVLGLENPVTAQSFNNLAGLYFEQGRYAEAELLFKQAQAIWKKTLDSDHPLLAASFNNLAGLYHKQGEHDKAELLYQQALAIVEKTQGSDHLDVAASLTNLGDLYRVRGRYTEAESLLHRALEICEKTLKPDHPAIADTLNALAVLYANQDRHSESELLQKRALKIQEETLGQDHPDVAIGLNNLAVLYERQSKYAEAEPLYQRAMAIIEKKLGAKHILEATVLKSYASLLRQTNRQAEAEKLEARAQAIREKHAQENMKR